MKWHYRWKRFWVRLRRLQARNQGDWFWLQSKPVPVAGLNRDLWRWAEPSSNYYIMLGLSGVIATLGLGNHFGASDHPGCGCGPCNALSISVIPVNPLDLKRPRSDRCGGAKQT